MNITERKTRYDGSVSEYNCRFVRRKEQELVLVYKIPKQFHIEAGNRTVDIPSGSVTVAYYWEDHPYNVYHWRTPDGMYLGSYFNIVKDTSISEKTVSYVDLIVDLMVWPDGFHAVLDLDELPEPLAAFENGSVERGLQQLIDRKAEMVDYLINETDRLIIDGFIKEIASLDQ